EPEPIRGSEMLALADIEAILDDAAVGEGNAFGQGRRPGRIEDEAHVTRAHRLLSLPQRRGAHPGPQAEKILRLEYSVHATAVHGHHGPETRQPRASKRPRRAARQLRTEVVQRIQIGPSPEGRDGDERRGSGVLERPAELAGR